MTRRRKASRKRAALSRQNNRGGGATPSFQSLMRANRAAQRPKTRGGDSRRSHARKAMFSELLRKVRPYVVVLLIVLIAWPVMRYSSVQVSGLRASDQLTADTLAETKVSGLQRLKLLTDTAELSDEVLSELPLASSVAIKSGLFSSTLTLHPLHS